VTDFQIYLTLIVFSAVIIAIAFDWIDMVVAALLGVAVLLAFNIVNAEDLRRIAGTAGGPLSLLFGGMVVARLLGQTGVFDRVGAIYLRATRGSGKRFLLLLIALVAPVCALLPNATTVILLAPVIIRVAQSLKVNFVGPMIITAIVSNAAGMLTLVGDPATFLVGSSIGMTFLEYLQKVSLAGLLAVLVVIPLLPRLMPEIWNAHIELPSVVQAAPIRKPVFVILSLTVFVLMVILFVVGEQLPTHVTPPAVAVIAASLALLVVFSAQSEPIEETFRAVDWKTLVFLGAIFFLVEALVKTGLVQSFSVALANEFGVAFAQVALVLLVGVGILSSLLANVPVVAAALVMTKGYLVAVEAVPELALASGFTDWPIETLPLFMAMMFGGTLGGNATMIGSSANIVSVGICAAHGERVTFMRFLRYGLPITLAQLSVTGIYMLLVMYCL